MADYTILIAKLESTEEGSPAVDEAIYDALGRRGEAAAPAFALCIAALRARAASEGQP